MADDDALKPMSDGDTTPPPATTQFEAAAPLKDAGVEFAAPGAGHDDGGPASPSEPSPTSVREGLAGLGTQATDRLRQVVDEGKSKIGDLLDQLAQTLNEAADQVDGKLGGQYGGVARNAATSVQGLVRTVRDKDVESLTSDVRGYVQHSPAIALGVATTLGFALARVTRAGFDHRS